MDEKRSEARMLCADLVEVEWRNKSGRLQTCVMNLEDISLSGACVQSDQQVHRGTRLCIHYGNGTLPGIVRYCVYRETGYFLGVEFSGGCKWPTNEFRPKHLLDPRKLVDRAVRRDTQAN
jgi:PilZ domain